MKKYLVPRGPCAECGTKTTSEWRPTDGLELCNACGLRARARKRGVPKAGPNKHQKGSVVQQKRYTAAMKNLRRETEMLKRENKERERLGFPLLPTKKELMKARGTLPPAPKSNQKKSNQKKSNQKKSNQKKSNQKKSDQKKSDQKKSTQKKTKEKKGKKVLGGTQKSKTPRRSGATAKSQGALAQMPALLHAIETAELPEAQPWPEELLQEAGLAAGPPKETDGTDGTVEKRKQRGKANAKEGGNQKIRAAGSAGTGEQPPYQRNDTEDQTIAEFLALIKDAPEAARSTPAEKRGGGTSAGEEEKGKDTGDPSSDVSLGRSTTGTSQPPWADPPAQRAPGGPGNCAHAQHAAGSAAPGTCTRLGASGLPRGGHGPATLEPQEITAPLPN